MPQAVITALQAPAVFASTATLQQTSLLQRSRAVSLTPPRADAAQERLQAAAFGAAAAVLLSATPAFAGVVLEQPKLRKAFQNEAEPAEVAKKSPGNPLEKGVAAVKSNEPVPKSIVEENSEATFEPRLLWPAGVVAAGGLLFALTKIDPGFFDMLEATSARDSYNVGIGNEGSLKGVGKDNYSAAYYEEGRVNSVTAKRMAGAGTKVLKKKK